jgi:hypothetical protein
MRRVWSAAACAIAAIGMVMFTPPAPASQLSTVGPVMLNSNGDTVLLGLSGIYLATVSGTYLYDNRIPTSADAECSQSHPLSTAVADRIAHDDLGLGYGNLYPSPLSQWQRYRYGISLDGLLSAPPNPFFTEDPRDDVLDVYIDGSAQLWIPVLPTPVDVAPGPGLDAGCNTRDHTYSTLVIAVGGATAFRIFDVNYGDNSGRLSLTVTKLL